MTFKQQLSGIAGIKPSVIPSGYQSVGDIILLKLPKANSREKMKIAEGVMKLLPHVRAVAEIKGVEGELREPSVRLLAGSRTDTIHTENGVKYHIDVSKVMLSKGNASERQRLVKKIKAGETVVDMFAGIGYFSLPIAKHTGAGKIVSIEKNLAAFEFLKDNIKLNGISNIDAIWGDCRDFAETVKGFADRVIMGYLPKTEEFLPHAISISKGGGMVHYHNICSVKDLWKKPAEHIKEACDKAGCGFEIIEKKKVKSYKPGVLHIAVDFRVEK